jgi:hypothetical protein
MFYFFYYVTEDETRTQGGIKKDIYQCIKTVSITLTLRR